MAAFLLMDVKGRFSMFYPERYYRGTEFSPILMIGVQSGHSMKQGGSHDYHMGDWVRYHGMSELPGYIDLSSWSDTDLVAKLYPVIHSVDNVNDVIEWIGLNGLTPVLMYVKFYQVSTKPKLAAIHCFHNKSRFFFVRDEGQMADSNFSPNRRLNRIH